MVLGGRRWLVVDNCVNRLALLSLDLKREESYSVAKCAGSFSDIRVSSDSNFHL